MKSSLPYVLCLCIAAVITSAITTTACGEEPFGVSLLDPNSLTGWEHSAEPVKGWTIEKGTLRGGAGSSKLLSGWTFGDFELRFIWKAQDSGRLKVGLPQVPGGHELAIELGAPTQAGTASIRRQQGTLVISANGREIGRHNVEPPARFGLSLAASGGPVEVSNVRVQEFTSGDDPAGTAMFNGRDLTGWWTPGNKSAWGVKDGNLALVGGNGNYLRSDKEYGNFTLSLEYKIRRRGNSGIGIRTARNGWPSGDGMEMQIEDSRKLDASATMAIYRNLEPIALNEKTEDWNHAVIKADGRMISAWLNGALVQQVNTAFLPELRHRPLKGWIGFQDHGAPIEFRNLRIIEAPDGLGLDAWHAPRNEPAARLVLDRLMNPERLTLRDGSKANVIKAAVTTGAETVLADLEGPGALVCVTRTSDSGKLALYFDGETKPRIECPASQLNQHVPQVCGDGNPVLTFLGYQKSLRVVVRDARQAEYRLEYVTLPPEMPVETFRHKTQSIERGLLAAIDYRHFQMSHGTYRDNDPLPRAASGNKTLARGERMEMFQLEGAGMIKWLRLHADAKLLTSDDLWLEVTIDGEKSPALATPARFLFPGLDEGKNYHNFLVFNKGGFVNVLPMPYGQGITIAAVNRGSKELKNVGLSVSYDTAENRSMEFAKRLRLRGQLVSSGATDFVTLKSARLIGLVCETPAEASGIVLKGMVPVAEGPHCLCGRTKSLSWSFSLLAPQDVDLQTLGLSPGRTLALFYSE